MKKSERRQLILQSAREVFATKGYHATGVSDIIERAKIARGTFYLYFKGKRDIFEKLLDELFVLIQKWVKLIDISSEAKISPLEQLRGNVEGIVNVLFENIQLTKILLSEAVGLDADFDNKLMEFYGRLIDLIESSLRTGIKLGVVRKCDTRIAAVCILGTVKEATYHQAMSSSFISREKFVDELLRFSLNGIYREKIEI